MNQKIVLNYLDLLGKIYKERDIGIFSKTHELLLEYEDLLPLLKKRATSNSDHRRSAAKEIFSNYSSSRDNEWVEHLKSNLENLGCPPELIEGYMELSYYHSRPNDDLINISLILGFLNIVQLEAADDSVLDWDSIHQIYLLLDKIFTCNLEQYLKISQRKLRKSRSVDFNQQSIKNQSKGTPDLNKIRLKLALDHHYQICNRLINKTSEYENPKTRESTRESYRLKFQAKADEENLSAIAQSLFRTTAGRQNIDFNSTGDCYSSTDSTFSSTMKRGAEGHNQKKLKVETSLNSLFSKLKNMDNSGHILQTEEKLLQLEEKVAQNEEKIKILLGYKKLCLRQVEALSKFCGEIKNLKKENHQLLNQLSDFKKLFKFMCERMSENPC